VLEYEFLLMVDPLRIKMRGLLAGFFLLMVGCSVGPDYQAPKSVMPQAWLEGANVEIDAQPAELARWWGEFNDPLLDSLIERAAKSNLDIALAEARVRRRAHCSE
jgi:outer membrane protein TolC